MRRFWIVPVLPCFLLALTVPVQARSLGAATAANMLRTAAVGSLIGFCAGADTYGASNNTDPEALLIDTIYGFVGGAALGTGLTAVEFGFNQEHIDGTVCKYVSTGAGIGMTMGVVVALIPYAQKERNHKGECANFNEGFIGLGLGGLIGGGLGLGIALVDLGFNTPDSSGDPSREKPSVQGTLGFMPEDGILPPVKEGEWRAPALWCRVVSVEF